MRLPDGKRAKPSSAVLLARQLLHGQLVHRLVILQGLRQAGFQVCGVQQVGGLARESDLRLGAGQCGL